MNSIWDEVECCGGMRAWCLGKEVSAKDGVLILTEFDYKICYCPFCGYEIKYASLHKLTEQERLFALEGVTRERQGDSEGI